MKRDMELIRKILLAIEDSDKAQGWIPLQFEGYNDDQISYQVKILAEQGIIRATSSSGTNNFAWHAIRIGNSFFRAT
jgi:hypothetical protein